MDPYDFRPIIFNGVELPAELMGISILECILPMPESVADWLWRLPICRGIEKHSDSCLARNACEFARDALVEHQARVIAEIELRFPLYAPKEIHEKWMVGLTKIIELSLKSPVCRWHALLSSGDPISTPEGAREFLQNLEQYRQKISEEGSGG